MTSGSAGTFTGQDGFPKNKKIGSYLVTQPAGRQAGRQGGEVRSWMGRGEERVWSCREGRALVASSQFLVAAAVAISRSR